MPNPKLRLPVKRVLRQILNRTSMGEIQTAETVAHRNLGENPRVLSMLEVGPRHKRVFAETVRLLLRRRQRQHLVESSRTAQGGAYVRELSRAISNQKGRQVRGMLASPNNPVPISGWDGYKAYTGQVGIHLNPQTIEPWQKQLARALYFRGSLVAAPRSKRFPFL